ncbi:MAG: hypothetical protein ACYC4L_20975 [Chloroflexota bacterium]
MSGQIKVVDACPTDSDLGVWVDGERKLRSVSFLGELPLSPLSAGTHHIAAIGQQTGHILTGQLDIPLDGNDSYTIMAACPVNCSGQIEFKVLPQQRPRGRFRRPGLGRQRRAVWVRVYHGAEQVDAFQVTTPQSLEASVQPILKWLPLDGSRLEMTGEVEQWLPFGIWRRRHRQPLPDVVAAEAFLAA